MEFAPLAAAEAGVDGEAIQAALAPWFIPILVTGATTFAVGVFAFAKGIADSRILSRRLRRAVVWGLVVMAGRALRAGGGAVPLRQSRLLSRAGARTAGEGQAAVR